MLSRIQLSAILLVAAVLWAIALVLQGVRVTAAWFHAFSIVLGILVLLMTLLDKWAWRWAFLQPWLVHLPDLQGTWETEIRPTASPEHSPQSNGPVNGFMVIRQTYSTIRLRLLTEQSSSEDIAARIVRSDDGVFSLAGVYRNTPKLSVRNRSPLHHGAILLEVRGNPPSALDGQYWTDRLSQGELRLARWSPHLVHSFDEAKLAQSASATNTPGAKTARTTSAKTLVFL